MLPIETISASDLDDYMNRPDAVIIDLRTPEEYEKSHIRTAVNIPYENPENLPAILQEKSPYSILRKRQQQFICCKRVDENGVSGEIRSRRNTMLSRF